MLTELYYTIISLDSWIVIAVIALFVSIGISFIQKYKGNQPKIRRLKQDIKKLRKKLKKHKNDTDKMMEVQGEMTTKNLEVMKESFRPMVYYIIPTLLIFLWMGSSLAYEPLQPNQPFNVTLQLEENYEENLNDVTLTFSPELQIVSSTIIEEDNRLTWTLQGGEDDYNLLFEGPGFSESKSIFVTEQRRYTTPVEEGQSPIQNVIIGNKDVTPLGDISIFGWTPGWLGTYILFNVLFGFSTRKLLRVA